jgi:hypothetical protein
MCHVIAFISLLNKDLEAGSQNLDCLTNFHVFCWRFAGKLNTDIESTKRATTATADVRL